MGHEKWRPEKYYLKKRDCPNHIIIASATPEYKQLIKFTCRISFFCSFGTILDVGRHYLRSDLDWRIKSMKKWMLVHDDFWFMIFIDQNGVNQYVSLFPPKLLEILKYLCYCWVLSLSAAVTWPLKVCYCFVKIKTKR